MMKIMGKRKNKGFSLGETLVVVAIIGVLCALSFVAVMTYQRDLHSLEMDATAKELFLAAQNHLSMIDGQEFLGLTSADGNVSTFGNNDVFFKTASDGENVDNIFYYVVGGSGSGYAKPDTEGTALNLMLPQGAIEDTVRTGGSYIIRYQKEPAQVLDVFYAEKTGRFAYTFLADDGTEYQSLMTSYRSSSLSRKNYGSTKAVIGYYGGTQAVHIERGTTIMAPTVTIENGDQLTAKVINNNDSLNTAALTLIVRAKGALSGIEIPLITQDGSGNGTAVTGANVAYDGVSTFSVIMDDVTVNGLHFEDLFGSIIVPGSDIEVYAVSRNNTKYTNIAESSIAEANSLFASVEAGTAEISSFRHLENLDPTISAYAFSANPIAMAVQTSDLDWSSFLANTKGNSVSTASGDTVSADGSYLPVSPSYTFSYEGNNCCISNVTVAGASTNGGAVSTLANAGIFGNPTGLTSVSSLELCDFDISGTNAGALAGSLTGTAVEGVLVRCSSDRWDIKISGISNAGGLIGSLTSGSISNCAAAVYVKGASGNAGGLAGSVSASSVTNSYSGGHTANALYVDSEGAKGGYNVIGVNAGGLLGNAVNTGINFCYSTCSVKGNNATAGGLLGTINTGTVYNSYSVGKVFGTSAGATAPFIGKADSTAFQGNYYLTGVTENEKDNTMMATEVSGRDVDQTKFIRPVEKNAGDSPSVRQKANPYDRTLVANYTGRYYFPTVAQLHENVNDSFSGYPYFLATHYGDWQVPGLTPLKAVITNADKLTFEFQLENDTAQAMLTVTGEQSGKTKVFLFKIDRASGTASIVQEGSVSSGASLTDGNIVWADTVTTDLPFTLGTSSMESGKKSITVTLDDITAENKHFCEVFPTLIPGEDITVRVASGKGSFSELCKMKDSVNHSQPAPVYKENSLFARSNEDRTTYGASSLSAEIAYVRHLQNLDTVTSKVSGLVKTATVIKDVTWKSADYPQICFANQSSGLASSISGSFHGIYNGSLNSFDGNNHTITGLVIKSLPGVTADGNAESNAGLFRLVTTNLNVSRVQLKDFSVNAYHKAGTLIAQIWENASSTSGIKVNISDVLVLSSNKTVNSDHSYAGGLIGFYQGCPTTRLTIDNCAASAVVKGYLDTGGLMGNATRIFTVTDSYAGGHTKTGTAVYSTVSGQYNVTSVTGNAGGLIGNVGADAAGSSISTSFSAASVESKDLPQRGAGGFIGSVYGNISINQAYAIAPVCGVVVTKDGGSSNAGAFIGRIGSGITVNNTNTYYLFEVYEGNESSETGETYVAYLGSGAAGSMKQVDVAYYEKDGKTNTISAKQGHMQQKTVPFDSALNTNTYGSTSEYPFSIWTVFNFGDSKGRTYYGDWQPVLNPATVKWTVSFYYDKLADDGKTYETVPYSSTYLNKEIIQNKNNTLYSPPINNIAAHTFAGWRIGVVTVVDGNEIVNYLVDNKGTPDDTSDDDYIYANRSGRNVTIPAEYCNAKLRLVATFTRNPDFMLTFFAPDFNGDGTIRRFTQTGNALSAKSDGSTILGSIAQKIPTAVKPGYVFEGWYENSDYSGDPVDFTQNVAVTGDMDFYAKFKKITYYDINAYFQFQQDPENNSDVMSLGIQPVSIQYIEGNVFNQTIALSSALTGLDSVAIKYSFGTEQPKPVAGNTDGVSAVLTQNADKSFKLTLKADKATNFYLIFTGNSALTTPYNYKIVYRLHNTAEDGSYSAGASDIKLETITKDMNNNVLSAPEGTYTNVVPADLSSRGYVAPTSSDIKNVSISKDTAKNVVYVDYWRKSFMFTYNSLGGTYIAPATLSSGVSLSSLIPSNPTREGYSFSEWAIHNQGDSLTAKNYNWTGTNSVMPANNVEAAAVWTPANVNFRVAYWYENSDSTDLLSKDNYSYMGSVTKQATTGTKVSSSSYSSYPGMSTTAHTNHSISCYDGIGTQITTSNNGTRYYIGSSRITINNTNAGNLVITGYKYNNDSTRTGLCVKINGTWYVYTGNVAAGGTLTCKVNTQVYSWIDTAHFTYNPALSETNVEVKGDGTTVLNVYYYRNYYTLTFKAAAKCGLEVHSHTDSCYTYLCGQTHIHTAECLICTKPEHTHSSSCCVLTEHSHTEACLTCAHTHTAACYGVSGNGSSTVPGSWDNSNDKEEFMNELGLENGYVYYYHDGQWRGTDHYILYIGDKYYNISSSTYNAIKTGSAIASGSFTGSGWFAQTDEYFKYAAAPSNCSHSHGEACFENCPVSYAHAHGDGHCVYSCGIEEHTHSEADGCYKDRAHVHTSGCEKILTCGKAEHAHNDYCNNANQNNTVGVIIAKYNSKIVGKFPINGLTTSWQDSSNPKYFEQVLLTIERMPGRNLNFTKDTANRTYDKTIKYYVQTIDSAEAYVKSLDSYKFKLYKQVTHGFTFITKPEEIHDIAGFTQYAATENGEVELLADSTKKEFHYKNNDKLNEIYYIRNSYTIEYYIDGDRSSTASVPYEKPLAGYNTTPARPSNIPADYTFSGWYKDPDLKNQFNFSAEIMPAGNLVLYAKWQPPTYTVNFYKEYSDIAAGTPWKTFTVEKYKNVGDEIANSTGLLKAEYTPAKTDYNFVEWSIGTQDNPEPFIYYMGITGDLNVFARWDNPNVAKDATVTVQYRYKDAAGNLQPFVDADGNPITNASGDPVTDSNGNPIVDQTLTYQVGKSVTFASKTISGYYAQQALITQTIVEEEDNNVITFVYLPTSKWSYNIEYDIIFDNAITGETPEEKESKLTAAEALLGLSFEREAQTYTISSSSKDTDRQYESVSYTVQSGFENYRLVGYYVETGSGRTYTANTSGQNYIAMVQQPEDSTAPTVRFILEPDPNAANFDDRYTIYDGMSHKKEIVSVETTYGAPAGVSTLSHELIYFFTGEGEASAVGTYPVKGYLVMNIDGARYLVWQDETDTVNLVIGRRSITLTSASDSKVFDNVALTRDNPLTDIIVSGDGWASYEKDGVMVNEGADYIFAVDSFRLNVGTSSNAFTYDLWTNTDINNYNIAVEYGTLTVTAE